MNHKIAILACFACRLAFAQTAVTTSTFNNVGVVIQLPASLAPDILQMFVKTNGAPPADFREVHPLSRLATNRFAGSVLGLRPGGRYDFKVPVPALTVDLMFSATTRSDNFPDATNITHHVSSLTGNDASNGLSFAQAYRSLAKALSVANAGGKILLYDGNYYEGDLSAPRSGTAPAPIVIENAPGARPVLSGIDTSFTPVWTLYNAGSHVYRTPRASAPENAYLNGGQFFHYPALADLLTPPWNQPGGYFADGSFLYARFPNDAAPGTNSVTIPAHTTGLTILQKSNLQIRGLEFCYYGLDAFHRGIYIDGGDSNVIDRCFFHHNGVGVAFKRAADFNTVQNCAFTEYPLATWRIFVPSPRDTNSPPRFREKIPPGLSPPSGNSSSTRAALPCQRSSNAPGRWCCLPNRIRRRTLET